MARVKRGVIARASQENFGKQTKGYYGARSRVYRVAFGLLSKLVSMLTVTVVNVKRQFDQLWIARINAAARQNGISYSKIHQWPEKASVEIDRGSRLISQYSTSSVHRSG